MDFETIRKDLQLFKNEFQNITRSRHPIEIKQFIVGQHESRWRQWYQICIETESKYRALQEAEADIRLAELEIEELELKKIAKPTLRWEEIHNEKLAIEIQKKRNQLEVSSNLMKGALKEIADFLNIAKTDYPEFWGKTEEELYLEHEVTYWTERLSRQIEVDLLTFGKIQAGNLDALLHLPMSEQKSVLMRSFHKLENFSQIEEQAKTCYLEEKQENLRQLTQAVEKTLKLKDKSHE